MSKKIFFSNLKVQTHFKDKKWNEPYEATGIVISGEDHEVKSDKKLLRFLAQLHFGKQRGFKFDLNRIRIVSIEKRFEMGLGYLQGQKNKLKIK